MNKTVAEARQLVSTLVPLVKDISAVKTVLCPPATSLLPVSALLEGTEIGLGAQNMHWEIGGAYTGELAPAMVREFCDFVILGHSERRAYFGETDESVNKKILAAQTIGLTPIICVGESLAENQAGETTEVVTRQIRAGLANVTPNLVIAYEPIWAIGTGLAATGETANATIKTIRTVLADLFGQDEAEKIRILYGGSVKPANAAEFFSQPEIDGALVGGASLKAEVFAEIVAAAKKIVRQSFKKTLLRKNHINE
jgi:triosephosphate isomerase